MLTQNKHIQNPLLLFLLAGLHFGIMQACLSLTTQTNITATVLGYFLTVFAWMMGIIINMSFKVPFSFTQKLLISLVAYCTYFIISLYCVPTPAIWSIYFILTVLTALPAGEFFKQFSSMAPSSQIFFHENNGFIIGTVLGMCGYVQWGVRFISIAPTLSFIFLIAYVTHRNRLTLWLTTATTLFFVLTKEYACFAIMLTFLAYSFIPKSFCISNSIKHIPHDNRLINRFAPLLIFIAGFNSMFLQFFIVRDFIIILGACEFTLLLVACVFFSSYSIGYAIAPLFRVQSLWMLATVSFFAHMAILIFSKPLAGLLVAQGQGYWVLFLLLFLVAVFSAPFYALALPQIIALRGSSSLPKVYSWDLLGALCGIAIMLLLTHIAPHSLLPIYFILLAVMALILVYSSKIKLLCVLALGITLFFFIQYQGPLFKLGLEDYYATRGYSHPKVLFSGQSFYHGVDIIETYDDAEQTVPKKRVSFINGIRYFDVLSNQLTPNDKATSLGEFTYYLAELPAKYLSEKLKRKINVLIMGAGSMSSIARVEPYSNHTVLVEIDPLIIESSKSIWRDVNQHDQLENYEIVINDAKHYLQTTTEQFDLIVNDVSAPYYIGTALMHSKDLFTLAKSKLAPWGLLAESTQSRPNPKKRTSAAMKILAGVTSVFPYYCVVEQVKAGSDSKKGFVYAASDGPLDMNILKEALKNDGRWNTVKIYDQASGRFNLQDVIPYSKQNMEILFSRNINRLTSRIKRTPKNIDASQSKLKRAIFKKLGFNS